MIYRQLRQRPTPQEWSVVAWMIIVVLAAMGAVGFWYAAGAGPEKADVASQLRSVSMGCWAVAALTWMLKYGLEWYLS
jgi:hypothetical protein